MTITDLIMKLENIRDEIDIDADPDVFIRVGAQEAKLDGIVYHPESSYNYECIVLY